jgi:hypothetical protein
VKSVSGKKQMTRHSTPVFYYCEASSLDGFVIEVGWAYLNPDNEKISSDFYLVHPLSEWQIETVWDESSEAVHAMYPSAVGRLALMSVFEIAA